MLHGEVKRGEATFLAPHTAQNSRPPFLALPHVVCPSRVSSAGSHESSGIGRHFGRVPQRASVSVTLVCLSCALSCFFSSSSSPV